MLLLAAFNLVTCQKPEPRIFASILTSYGVEEDNSTLVIRRASDNMLWISNSERAAQRFVPASTSKIPHTLIALETGIASANSVFEWDGEARAFKAWDQDQTLTQAYKRSAAWVYQDITGTLGVDVMVEWLKIFSYGNYDGITSENVDRYWLSGPLEISAVEQEAFLSKLARRELPLSVETYETSQTMFENERNGNYMLYAKTGWKRDPPSMDIGWFVGWVENQDNSELYVFAFNMDMSERGDHKKRKPIVMDALKAVGAWPE